MTTNSHKQRSTDVQHRAHHQPAPGRVEVREVGDAGDGLFRVRMPIASTGEVRNDGDDPLSDEEIEGMAQQIDERSIGVFLDHGTSDDVSDTRYGAVEKLGEWDDPGLETRDGETELVADAAMMDPETLPSATESVREVLATLKEQADRGLSLSSSIGWRDDRDYPGGVDLMEGSIVGIPADPRTSQNFAAAKARSAAVDESPTAETGLPTWVGGESTTATRDRVERALEEIARFVDHRADVDRREGPVDEVTRSTEHQTDASKQDPGAPLQQLRSVLGFDAGNATERIASLRDGNRSPEQVEAAVASLREQLAAERRRQRAPGTGGMNRFAALEDALDAVEAVVGGGD